MLYKNKHSRRNLVLAELRQTSSCHELSQNFIQMCRHIHVEMPVKVKKGAYMLQCPEERPESTRERANQDAMFKQIQLSDGSPI